ncbi:hypothetical protein UY3_13981 [Chelonia mydas]|uniref:Uncharacterized protein n=1 Tax=Chelonia mydas TaxID=8469 RepID=M7AU57_CHEMY|nr:hypothetical protein UY3_13981 [Chelonia mydas]
MMAASHWKTQKWAPESSGRNFAWIDAAAMCLWSSQYTLKSSGTEREKYSRMVESSRKDNEAVCCISDRSCSHTTGSIQRSHIGPEGTDTLVMGAAVRMGDLALKQVKEQDQEVSQGFQGGHWAYG